ncbi:MAG: ATP-binding protein [Bacteroidetes bacterium SW_11_45_7]|nr:MAG: ATP-binding protein [Bacteroidetes bacterium SW_11_45_7]
MGEATKDYHKTIKSSPDNVSEVEAFIDQLRQEDLIDEQAYGNILISLTEAVNNAILHGNKSDESKNVDITCKLNDNMVSFIVSDEGAGFDFNSLPDPTDPANVEKLTGRGVFLMKQLSDYVIFSNNGSTVELQFKV